MIDKNSSTMDSINTCRRSFILRAAAVIVASTPLASRQAHAATQARHLRFYHMHTGERLDIDYHDGSSYIPDAIADINHLLRDFRTDEIHPIDVKLLDILHRLQLVTNNSGTFEVISGYRSPATNSKLRKRSKGVAKGSLHMQGKAIDIRLTGCDTHLLYKTCKSFAKGGVGYYAKSDFIHVDTGRVRHW